MGGVSDQVALVLAFDAWLSAERATHYADVPAQQAKANNLHKALFVAALRCGFDPLDFHADVSLTEWSAVRVALNRRVLRNNVAEASRKEA